MTATIVAAVGLLAHPAGAAGMASSDTAPARATKLLIRYAASSDCTILSNYPGTGVVGNDTRSWTVRAGKTIIWRYNVDATWAVVSDPARAEDRDFAWWGFTRRNCIGKSIKQQDYPAGVAVPTRILEGRSQLDAGWRPVHFAIPAVPVTAQHQKVHRDGTLRDPHNFVIGNVFADWHVNVTGTRRGNGHWVLVYVPNTGRWGYLEAAKLRPVR